ncbi:MULTISPECIES: sporulation protein YqfD [unclassified Ruminococcus]|uniref:sporulation protein YqfD n=1 Tax=unclassified Ruminococcus TaxID=2608920 RepID=UPI00210D9688|nr:MULTISPECIES: sporulation protein YqfD [unclassified Ruminococcus]MCQ4021901.1 hypothetical protein [Ruminococcus sp. zg-924]MCQ4114346.1 hypothetical protein [Ruminococcus sp. zg-921]
MVILSITRFIRGYVEFRATGSFPERLINLTIRRGINVYDTKGCDGVLTGRVPKSHFASLQKLGARCGVDIEAVKCGGVPFVFKNNINRWGLIPGAAVFLIICSVLSSFVWVVDVSPTPKVSEYKIRQELEKQGLYSGAWKGSLSPDSIERNTMINLGSFGWMSVNVTGAYARVGISEKYLPGDTQGEEQKPCNIKAKKDGQIVKMDVKSGSSVAKLGDAVTKGDLLVSGVVSTENGGDFLKPSIANVYAQTTLTKTVSQPLKYTQSLPSGKEVSRSLLELVGLKIPLGLGYIPSGEYVRHSEHLNFYAFDNQMPVGIYSENCTEYAMQEISLSESEADKVCMAQLALYEAFELFDVKIEDRKLTHKVKDNAYILTAEYTCIEDIGEVSYIGIDEED